ncbi:MAG: hypothetical protein HUU22_12350 [Phycisphaerae bacterium]|nr:hypothetical protein [Phycisphaerae bacterium]NUQ46809.1 hypothetical protein [Phycisphaerae bacterium]
MEGRKLGGIVLSLLIIGGLFYFKMQRRSDTSDEVRTLMVSLIERMPEYQSEGKVLTQMAGFAHTVAFGEAYTVGYKARRTKLEEQKYFEVFFRSMIEQARDRGKPNLIKPLSELRDSVLAAAEEQENPG